MKIHSSSIIPNLRLESRQQQMDLHKTNNIKLKTAYEILKELKIIGFENTSLSCVCLINNIGSCTLIKDCIVLFDK